MIWVDQVESRSAHCRQGERPGKKRIEHILLSAGALQVTG